ncbi:MAG TPA: hypothetical protein VHO06_11220 [Polyangia bacterium]|nr:hypothetical protein [Polyangia bacterium]
MATKPDDTELVVLTGVHLAPREWPVTHFGRKRGEPRFFLNQADWSLWKSWGRLPLVDAILLSVDLDPVTEPGNVAKGQAKLDLFKHVLDADNHRRLKRRAGIVLSSLNDLRFADGTKGDLSSDVELPDFRELTDAKDLQVPREFPKARSEANPIGGRRWPWGSYETPQLRRLAEAAKEFWADGHDPDSAPRKEKIVASLRKNGASKGEAEAIAQILRPPSVRPGPRGTYRSKKK